MGEQVKIKYAVDGKASRGKPFFGTVTEETATHKRVDCGATKGVIAFSKSTGVGKNAGRQVILDGYPKDGASAAA